MITSQLANFVCLMFGARQVVYRRFYDCFVEMSDIFHITHGNLISCNMKNCD